jgi:HAD superfamily hydrolase (TIGR01509 family)
MKALQKIIENIEAVFFDLDGTLVFTEELHDDSYKEACKKLNIDYEQLKYPFPKNVYEAKKKIYLKKIKAKEYKINQEVYSFYLEQISNQKKVAIVTNTLKENVDIIVNSFDKKPDLIVSGSDFLQKIKPEPDMYIFGLKKLEVQPEKCLILEDSQKGIIAGISAGIKVFDVKNKVLYGPLST